MPQLEVWTFPSQIFWLIICFSILYYLLSRKALPRVSEILEARQDRIAADLDQAQRLRREAQAALATYEQAIAKAQDDAHRLLAEAQNRLQAEAAERQAELDRQLGAHLAEAEQRIAAAKDRALAETRGRRGRCRSGGGGTACGNQSLRAGSAARAPHRAREGRLMLELWLLIALLILIAIIYKPLTRTIFGALDGHAAKVRAELDEAKRLREEAQSLLAEHQRKLAAGKDQAQAIVEHARAEVQRQTERHGVELEATPAAPHRAGDGPNRARGGARAPGGAYAGSNARDPHDRAASGRSARRKAGAHLAR